MQDDQLELETFNASKADPEQLEGAAFYLKKFMLPVLSARKSHYSRKEPNSRVAAASWSDAPDV
jgi:hypothetical protein